MASPSSRRAWIEIDPVPEGFIGAAVALLAEGVDRNFASIDHRKLKRKVALLAEGVDRNRKKAFANDIEMESPSSRRAWIEIRSKSTTRS